MNIYKATFKEKKGESYWDSRALLIVAADYANAEDKAKNFRDSHELIELKLYGETTKKTDVFELRER